MNKSILLKTQFNNNNTAINIVNKKLTILWRLCVDIKRVADSVQINKYGYSRHKYARS